jgi:hypothetical protein
MRSYSIVIIIVSISILIIGGQIDSTLAITGQSVGYVQYSVRLTGISDFTVPENMLINETVTASSKTGFVTVTMDFKSDITNFTYSKDVNSSSIPMIFPYLSGLTNQSLSYTLQGISIMANLVNSGQVPVSFNDTTYQATNYLVSFSAMNSTSMKSISAEGKIVSMPSGLIHTIQLSFNQTLTVDIKLTSTNLALIEPKSSVNPIGASILGVGAIVAVAIAVPTIFKKLKHNKPNNQLQNNKLKVNQENEDEKKPAYWVD